MATDDIQRLVTGTASAPATFTVPGNGQMRPKAVFAHYDGSGAASSFVPALKITSDSGQLVGIYPSTTTVAAGASADASWFPRVGGSATQVFPPPPGPGFLIYDFHVTGAPKTSIDTAADGPFAGAFVTSLNILEIWLIARTTGFTGAPYHEDVTININGDAGAHYDINYIYGHDVTVSANQAVGGTAWLVDAHGVGGTANAPGLISITIPGYADTSFFKVGYDSSDLYDLAAPDNFQTLRESLGWRSTAAITRLQFQPAGAGDQFAVGTHVMIYGR